MQSACGPWPLQVGKMLSPAEGDNFACLGGDGGKTEAGPEKCPPRKPSSNISPTTGVAAGKVRGQFSRLHRRVTVTSTVHPTAGV
jgi:hypothetical protein